MPGVWRTGPDICSSGMSAMSSVSSRSDTLLAMMSEKCRASPASQPAPRGSILR